MQRFLAKYIKVLLKEGLPLEFFIEGGQQNRENGDAKYGILSMIIQAYQEKACEDLAAIPVYIGYDRVIEENLSPGAQRPPEGERKSDGDDQEQQAAPETVRSRVYERGGADPAQILPRGQEKPLDEMTIEERQESLSPDRLYDRPGDQQSVGRYPFALTAVGFALLRPEGILWENSGRFCPFQDYLTFSKVSFAMTFADREKAVGEEPCIS